MLDNFQSALIIPSTNQEKDIMSPKNSITNTNTNNNNNNIALPSDNKSLQFRLSTTFQLNQSPQQFFPFSKGSILNCICIFGETIAIGTASGDTLLYDLETLNNISTFQGHTGQVLCLCFCRMCGGKEYLATGSTDKNVVLWNICDESDTMILKGHDDSVTAILALSDYQTIVTGSADRKLIHWDIYESRIVNILPCNGSIFYLHLLKNGEQFASSDFSGAVNLWAMEFEERGGKVERIVLEKTIVNHQKITCLNSSFIEQGILIGGAEDSSIKFWDLKDQKQWKNNSGTSDKPKQIISKAHNAELADIILMEDSNSSKDNLRLHIFSIGNQDLRFIHRSTDRNVRLISNFQIVHQFVMPQFELRNCFSNQKMQIYQNQNKQKVQLFVVNQNPQAPSIFVFDIQQK